MINLLKTLVIFSALLSISGCSFLQKSDKPIAPKVIDPKIKPSWIDSPEKDPRVKEKLFGVGYSKTHIRGPREQKKLATADAINQIASQNKTTVDSSIDMIQASNGKSVSKNIISHSNQNVSGEVSSKEIDSWINPFNKDLYIFMIIE
jgi:hypothetical protein